MQGKPRALELSQMCLLDTLQRRVSPNKWYLRLCGTNATLIILVLQCDTRRCLHEFNVFDNEKKELSYFNIYCVKDSVSKKMTITRGELSSYTDTLNCDPELVYVPAVQ